MNRRNENKILVGAPITATKGVTVGACLGWQPYAIGSSPRHHPPREVNVSFRSCHLREGPAGAGSVRSLWRRAKAACSHVMILVPALPRVFVQPRVPPMDIERGAPTLLFRLLGRPLSLRSGDCPRPVPCPPALAHRARSLLEQSVLCRQPERSFRRVRRQRSVGGCRNAGETGRQMVPPAHTPKIRARGRATARLLIAS